MQSAVGMASCDTIYIWSFKKIGTGFQAILRLCLRSVRNCNIGITDGRGLWITNLRLARCYVYIKSFINISSGIQKLREGIRIQTQRQQVNLVGLLYCIIIRKIGQKAGETIQICTTNTYQYNSIQYNSLCISMFTQQHKSRLWRRREQNDKDKKQEKKGNSYRLENNKNSITPNIVRRKIKPGWNSYFIVRKNYDNNSNRLSEIISCSVKNGGEWQLQFWQR
jgi:hypothetical protein